MGWLTSLLTRETGILPCLPSPLESADLRKSPLSQCGGFQSAELAGKAGTVDHDRTIMMRFQASSKPGIPLLKMLPGQREGTREMAKLVENLQSGIKNEHSLGGDSLLHLIQGKNLRQGGGICRVRRRR
jgi:hypothetical protein